MSTEAQLKALSNSELASGTQIPALKHRTVNDAIIEEMYDAQSRGNVLSGVQTATSLASGDEVFVIRSGEAYLLDADELGFVSTLADLTDVNIPAPSNDQVLAYNFGTSKWVSKDVSSLSSVVSITGTATTNQMVKFTGLSSIGNSIVSDNGTTVNIGGNLSVDNNLTVGTINSGTSTDFVKGDGSLDGTTYQDEAEKNQANGYAPLDSGAKIPLANLPDSILGQVSYQGTWAASTNTPTLDNPPASTTKGEYYVASDDGTQFGIEFKTGDWIISNGTAWEKVDNTDAVTSVFGRLGNVIALQEDYEDFYVDFDSNQTITGQKTFGSGDLRIVSGGSGNLPTIFSNSQVGSSQEAGFNTLGFNGNNNLFFTKGETVDFNGAVLSYDNTGIRTYTLPDASGTFAFTSDLDDYVTINTSQTITSDKTFTNSSSASSYPFRILQTWNNASVLFEGLMVDITDTDSASTSSLMDIKTGGVSKFKVRRDGNVGIDEPTPTEKLDVNGNVKATSFIGSGVSLTSLNASNISSGTLADARLSSNVALKDIDNNFSVGQTIGGDTIINGNLTATNKVVTGNLEMSNALPAITMTDTDTNGYGRIRASNGDILIEADEGNTQASSNIRFEVDGTERMRIDSSGNVGIGTSAPRGLLDLGFSAAGALSNVTSQYQIVLEAPSGTGNFGRNIAFAESTGTNAVAAAINAVDEGASTATGLSFATGNNSTLTERMRIEPSGNVGIGTSSPDGLLEIESASNAGAILYISGGTNSDADIRFRQQGADRWLAGYDNSPDGFRFFDFQGTAGTRMFIESITGNVGIGTTAPADKLEIGGAGAGIILASPNGTRYRVTVTDLGVLNVAAV